MLGGSCTPCCTPNCEAFRSDMRVVSGTASLAEADGLPLVRSTEQCLVVTTPGQWKNAANEYFPDEELPGQLRVWMTGTLPEKTGATNHYVIPEFTHSALLWCDADGQNQAATVRLRVEHEGPDLFNTEAGAYVGPPENDALFTSGLPSHALTNSSFSGFPSLVFQGRYKALLVYAELLDGSGAVLQSVRMATPANNRSMTVSPLKIGFVVHAHISEGLLHCWVTIVDDFVFSYLPNSPTIIPQERDVNAWHIFDPVPLEATHQQIAFLVSDTPEPVLSDAVVARYPLNDFIVPCAPESKDGLCTSTNARLRPWAAEPCTRMLKSSRVRGQRCGGVRDSLVLTIPGTAIENNIPVPGFREVFPFAQILQGSYELTGYAENGDPLADGLFWYSQDDVDISFSGLNPIGTGLPNVFQQFTLTRIEMSAVAHAGPLRLALTGSGVTTPEFIVQGYCTNWTAEVWYMISLLIRRDNSNQREDYQRYSTVCRANSGASGIGALPESFLTGEAVSLQTGTQFIGGTLTPTHLAEWYWGLPEDRNTRTNTTTFTGTLPTIQLV